MNSRDSLDPLSQTLATWAVQPSASSSFRPDVWDRIQQRAQATWAGYVRTHAAGWSAAAALTLVLATWLGHQAGEARLAAARDEMVVSYLVDLDPRVQATLRLAK